MVFGPFRLFSEAFRRGKGIEKQVPCDSRVAPCMAMAQELLIVDEVLQTEAQGLFGLQPAVLGAPLELVMMFVI